MVQDTSPADAATQESTATEPSLHNPALTVDQLAKLLQLNRGTTYDKIRSGKIPGATWIDERVIRIHGPTVLAWLSSGQLPGSPKPRKGKQR